MTASTHRPGRSATPASSSGDLLTVEQAADYLNITEHFVRRLIRERRIPFGEPPRVQWRLSSPSSAAAGLVF